jgi:DNA-directed RNA polymerase specialized sigma24 family protein
MTSINPTAVFEERRRHLFGLAYRILGSRADAEDTVQDVFIKWLAADHASIDTGRLAHRHLHAALHRHAA